ncbi:DNA cytosine methyltransferase, partial [Xanthomonas citri pv. citri]
MEGFSSKGDKKHFLYKQYLGLLDEFSPAVFIMENVKGILTSKVGNKEMFAAIMRDLSDPAAALKREKKGGKNGYRYVLLPIHVEANQKRTSELVAEDPSAFIIKCENHGIPQARHRVIIMGVREDLLPNGIEDLPGLNAAEPVSVKKALEGLPRLRSGLSR